MNRVPAPMAAMNSGSELELLDLTSTEHRRGGGDRGNWETRLVGF